MNSVTTMRRHLIQGNKQHNIRTVAFGNGSSPLFLGLHPGTLAEFAWGRKKKKGFSNRTDGINIT